MLNSVSEKRPRLETRIVYEIHLTEMYKHDHFSLAIPTSTKIINNTNLAQKKSQNLMKGTTHHSTK